MACDLPEEVVEKTEHFLAFPEERHQMAARGYAVVKERYAIRRWVDKADSIIRKAVRDRAGTVTVSEPIAPEETRRERVQLASHCRANYRSLRRAGSKVR